MNCIATMIKPTEGKVLLAGEDISTFKGKKLAQFRGKEIGYLFQDFELLDNLTKEKEIEHIKDTNKINKVTVTSDEKMYVISLGRVFEVGN